MRALHRLAIVVAALAAVACDGSRLSAPGTAGTFPVGGVGGGTRPSGHFLVGSWRRTIFFVDEFGQAHSTETTWRFSESGSASRLTIARNHTAGLADSQYLEAQWEPLPQAVRITYLPPSSGTFEFSIRLEGSTLYLASQAYNRVGS